MGSSINSYRTNGLERPQAHMDVPPGACPDSHQAAILAKSIPAAVRNALAHAALIQAPLAVGWGLLAAAALLLSVRTSCG